VMWENLKDRWITWRTGKTKSQRDYEAWYNTTVVIRAHTAEDMFRNFKHILIVDLWKAFDVHMFTELKDDLIQYRWPQRALGDNIVYGILRGEQMPDGLFHLTDFGNEDRVYVATNNDQDAVMIALKYG
jgi:hypothetical protein